MCAIFGSKDLKTFQHLYSENLERGDFAAGFAFRQKNTGNFDVLKIQGNHFKIDADLSSYDMFFGHTQAPTSSIRTFNPETTHPFIVNKIIVAHNGVLSNELSLKANCKSPYNTVDSSVIPALLNDANSLNKETKEFEITSILSKLEGTYSLWIIHNNKSYIARSGSTLFYDKSNCNFSSVKVDEINTEIKEGILYKVDEKITEVGSFSANSPFLIL